METTCPSTSKFAINRILTVWLASYANLQLASTQLQGHDGSGVTLRLTLVPVTLSSQLSHSNKKNISIIIVVTMTTYPESGPMCRDKCRPFCSVFLQWDPYLPSFTPSPCTVAHQLGVRSVRNPTDSRGSEGGVNFTTGSYVQPRNSSQGGSKTTNLPSCII